MTSDNRTCIKILITLAIAFYGLWVWDARSDDFDPACWEPDLEEETPCVAEGWCER